MTALCAEPKGSYAELVGEYRMAWPKLRSRKSPGRLVTQSSHSGAAPDGAQSYGAAPNSASSAPETGEPAVWPGAGAAAEPSPAADAPAADASAADAPATDAPAADPEVPEEADEG